MKRYRVQVTVRKNDTVADPEGKTIRDALSRIGYAGVNRVRTGRIFFLEFESEGDEAAREFVENVSTDILSNPIIENFAFELKGI